MTLRRAGPILSADPNPGQGTGGSVRHLVDSYSLLPEAQTIAARLIAREPRHTEAERCEQFQAIDLAQPRIACVLSQPMLMLHGEPAAAYIGPSRVQAPQAHKGLYEFMVAGFCAALFDWEDVDYVIFFDAATWSTLDDVGREHLVYHELCHLKQRTDDAGDPAVDAEGRPKLALGRHDHEFFSEEVRAYGPEVAGLEDAAVAIADGHRAAKERSGRRLRRAG